MFKRTLILIAVGVMTLLSSSARTINVHGKVTFMGSKEPAPGVNIHDLDTNRFLTQTDDDGNFIITTDSESTLIFSNGGLTIEDKLVEMDGQLNLNVEVMRSKKMLDELEVTGTSKKKVFVLEDTDLEIDGNMLKIKNYRIRIPAKLFDSDKRLIIQPAVYNVTRDHVTFMSPVVIDGRRYAITQERMDDWDLSHDPLTQIPNYYVKKDDTLKDGIFILNDSLYVANPTDDLMAIIYPSIENYNRLVFTDSIEVARGLVNPFRFLEFHLEPLDMTDSRFIPADMPEPRDTEGELNLLFAVGKSRLDPKLGNNQEELNTLLEQFREIEKNPNSTLKGFEIYGSASPEGNPETNQRLAHERMNAALKWINSSYTFPKKLQPQVSASVAKWSDVVAMMRADNLNDEADQVQKILDTYSGPNGRFHAISRLPFYKSLIAEKYLPQLRRVNYTIKSEYYRPLTDEEIDELYHRDPSQLAKHHYYRYYSSREGQEREDILRNAVKTYPTGFPAAATDLSKIMLDKGEDPSAILAPYFVDYSSWSLTPVSMRHNYGVASMNNMHYSLADSLFSSIPDNRPEIHKAKLYSRVIQGDFADEVVSEVGQDSRLNRVLILLKQKRNNLAWQAAQTLGDSAIEDYIKAIAAHRMEEFIDYDYLESALRKDPSLINIAKVDGDVVDMLEHLDLEDILANPIKTDKNE